MELTTPQVLSAFAAVVSAVIYLWKQQNKNHSKTEKDLKDCLQGHADANKNLFDLNGRMSRLEGEHEGIQNLASAVLKEIRGLKK
jgi:hypothetical protein|tara:strand:- start:3528 stop:3782 length:255 start_codon:yes stop_codon:yes gene_type:complete